MLELLNSAADKFIILTVNYTLFFVIYGVAIYALTTVIFNLLSAVYRFFKKKWMRFRDSRKSDDK